MHRDTKAITYQNAKGQTRLVVSEALKEAVINIFYKSPGLGANFSGPTTTESIKSYFYWPKMKAMICNYCESCESCIIGKSRSGKPPGLLTSPTKSAFL